MRDNENNGLRRMGISIVCSECQTVITKGASCVAEASEADRGFNEILHHHDEYIRQRHDYIVSMFGELMLIQRENQTLINTIRKECKERIEVLEEKKNATNEGFYKEIISDHKKWQIQN